jgi:hypothetical protein
VGYGSPSAAETPLLKTKTTAITKKKTTKLRDGFMFRHCFDARIFDA